MITRRYVLLLKERTKIIIMINEAKEHSYQAEVDRLVENELFMVNHDIDEENFKMTGKFELE